MIAALDAAGIERAVVLSTAYIFEQPTRSVDQAPARVRAENDWTSQQVAPFPGRLVGFCGLNPLSNEAMAELARCAKDPHLRSGIKLHLGNSGFDYHNRAHIDRLREVFRAGNSHRMAIVVHMRASYNRRLSSAQAVGHRSRSTCVRAVRQKSMRRAAFSGTVAEAAVRR